MFLAFLRARWWSSRKSLEAFGSLSTTRNSTKISSLNQLPIPRVDHVLDSLGKGPVFSLFDLVSLDSFMLPWRRAQSANARAFLLVGRYEHLHPRWWLRHCLKCQARKTSRLTVQWPVISMPLPGITVSVEYFGPLPVTPRGNTYILLFTDCFSRRADMYAVTAAEFTAEGAADILINR